MNAMPPTSRLPHFVIIGAMKSATTTLHRQLSEQPGIFVCTPKEPNFFSDDREYARGLAWYAGLFADAPHTSLLGEASTHYTKLPTHPDSVPRIRQHLPEARWIYVMRQPVDRLVSHFIHEWSMGVYRCGIREAIDRYPELVDYGRYAMQLEPWFEAFGRDRVLPVFFDRLLAAPQAELERICTFIGYPGQPQWMQELKAENVSSERIRRFPGYRVLIESAAATWLRRNLVPQGLRNRVKSRLRMQERPQLDDATRAELETRFDPDLARLGQWLGTELDCRNFRQVTAAGPLNWVASHD